MIDESHHCWNCLYLKNKPVRELKGDEFLKLSQAETDGLLTIKISVDMDHSLERRYSNLKAVIPVFSHETGFVSCGTNVYRGRLCRFTMDYHFLLHTICDICCPSNLLLIKTYAKNVIRLVKFNCMWFSKVNQFMLPGLDRIPFLSQLLLFHYTLKNVMLTVFLAWHWLNLARPIKERILRKLDTGFGYEVSGWFWCFVSMA